MQEECFSDLTYLKVDIMSIEQIMSESAIAGDQKGSHIISAIGSASLASDFIIINPSSNAMNKPVKVRLNLKSQPKTFESIIVYRLNTDYSTMIKLDSKVEDDHVTFETNSYGGFVAKTEKDFTVLIVVLCSVGFFAIVVSAIGFFLYKNPKYWKRMKYTACNAKRSMSDQI